MSYIEEQLIKLQIELSQAKADRCKAVQLMHEAQGRVRELEAENAELWQRIFDLELKITEYGVIVHRAEQVLEENS